MKQDSVVDREAPDPSFIRETIQQTADEAAVNAFFDSLQHLPDDEHSNDFLRGRPLNERLNRVDFNEDDDDFTFENAQHLPH